MEIPFPGLPFRAQQGFTRFPRRGRCRPQILMPADRVDYQQPKAGLLVFFERSEV